MRYGKSKGTKVEVVRESLVEALKKKLKEDQDRFSSETLQFNQKDKAFRKSFVLRLKKLIKSAEGGEEIPSKYNIQSEVFGELGRPDEPKPVSSKFELALKKLSLIKSDTLQVADDSDYFDLI